jgi:diacylglycerol kinase (ATP)
MRKVLLLYNPLSGRRRGRRLADVHSAAAVMRAAGIDVAASATQVAGDATKQVKQAADEGCDTIFACGGDGTVSDTLQGLVGTECSLGVIPLGTANSLAHDLRLPLSPVGAARSALSAKPRRIAVGRVQYLDFKGNLQSRYFIVAVGIGVDAHLFYKLSPLLKRHLGMMAYYVKATRLWLTHRMQIFEIETAHASDSRQAQVSQLLAVRIQDFGGILRQLAPGASLERDDLRLVLFHTRNRAAYLGYIMRGFLGTRWKIPGIELIDSSGVSCRHLPSSSAVPRIFVEADGELLGTLPAELGVVPNAVNLLVP